MNKHESCKHCQNKSILHYAIKCIKVVKLKSEEIAASNNEVTLLTLLRYGIYFFDSSHYHFFSQQYWTNDVSSDQGFHTEIFVQVGEGKSMTASCCAECSEEGGVSLKSCKSCKSCMLVKYCDK
jgi:hypothetical protein